MWDLFNTEPLSDQDFLNEDVQLTLRLKQGDAKAYEQAFRQFHCHLYRIAIFYVKDPALAEDALQDVYLKLWTNRHLLNEHHSIKAFLSVSLKNHVLNLIRNRQREILRYIDYANSIAQAESPAESAGAERLQSAALEMSIAKLPPQKQKIFMLKTNQGLSNQEVADQLGLSINTIKFQYSQAIKLLREHLRQHVDFEAFTLLLISAYWQALL